MTNAEAIEHLKTIIIFSYQDGYTAEAREALEMAIKALEAQEWIPCYDAMERVNQASKASEFLRACAESEDK